MITECQAQQGLANWDQKAKLFQICTWGVSKDLHLSKTEHNCFTPYAVNAWHSFQITNCLDTGSKLTGKSLKDWHLNIGYINVLIDLAFLY